jgi:hypothetical protein
VRRARRRALLALLSLAAVIVVIAAIVLVTAPARTKVVLHNVVYPEVQRTAQALAQLVSENTK